MKNKINKTLFAIILVGMLLLSGCSGLVQKRTATVTGTSDFEVEPDQVEIYIAINTNATSADEAKDENAQITNKVIKMLKGEGIPEDDMETLNYNMYPDYYWQNGKREDRGYKVTNTIKVTTKEIDNIGTIVDVAVEGGATNINNIQFTLSDELEKEQKARANKEAGEDAKQKAEAIAEGLDLKLGKIQTVQESSVNYYPYRYGLLSASSIEKQAEVIHDTPIMPEKVDVSARITVVYRLK